MSAAGQRHMGRLAQLPCACCGAHGVHGDKSLMRIRKLSELDMLAETIRMLTDSRVRAFDGA